MKKVDLQKEVGPASPIEPTPATVAAQEEKRDERKNATKKLFSEYRKRAYHSHDTQNKNIA